MLKVMDMELFIRQISAYGVITQYNLVAISTWGLISVQFILGISFLISYRPSLMLMITLIMWLIILMETLWAFFSGTDRYTVQYRF